MTKLTCPNGHSEGFSEGQRAPTTIGGLIHGREQVTYISYRNLEYTCETCGVRFWVPMEMRSAGNWSSVGGRGLWKGKDRANEH